MSKPLIRIHNLETDEIIDREMTDEEFAVYQTEITEHENAKTEEIEKALQKAQLLAKLGITEDDAKLLLS